MLAIFFIAFTFIDYGEVKGQCPSGSSLTTADFTYNGCDYRVSFCYSCKPIPDPPISIDDDIEVRSITVLTGDPTVCLIPFNGTNFVQTMYLAILTKYADILCPNHYPCEDNQRRKVVRINTLECWQYKWSLILSELTATVCDGETAKCVSTFEICFNSNPPTPYNQISHTGTSFQGTSSCPTGNPETILGSHPYLWTTPRWLTECYRVELCEGFDWW